MEALSPQPELNPRGRRRERRRLLPLWLFGNGGAGLEAFSGRPRKALLPARFAKAFSLLSASCLVAGGYFGGRTARSRLAAPFERPSLSFPQRDPVEQKLLDDLSREAEAPSANSLGMVNRANSGALSGKGTAPGAAGGVPAGAGRAGPAAIGAPSSPAGGSAGESGSQAATGQTAGAEGGVAGPPGDAVAGAGAPARLPASGFGRLRDSVSAGRLSGGPGLSGGIAGKFGSGLGNSLLARAKGEAAAPGSAAGLSKSARPRMKSGVLPRGAGSLSLSAPTARRLERMERALAPTKASPDFQTSAETHTQEWSSPQDAGSAAQTAGVPSTSIGSGPGMSAGGAGAGEGGPLNPDGISRRRTDPPQAPPVRGGKDKTPNKGLIEAAQYLLLAASGLLVVAGLLGLWADAAAGGTFGLSEFLAGAAMVLAAIAAVLALTVIGIGAALLAQGNPLQGAIFMVVGLVLTVIAAVAAKNYYDAMGAYSAAGDAAQSAAEAGARADALTARADAADQALLSKPVDQVTPEMVDAATQADQAAHAATLEAEQASQAASQTITTQTGNAQSALGSISKPFDGGAIPLSGAGALSGAMGAGAGAGGGS